MANVDIRMIAKTICFYLLVTLLGFSPKTKPGCSYNNTCMKNVFFGNTCISYLKLLQNKVLENLEICTDSPVIADML